jgi:hypothetical protein
MFDQITVILFECGQDGVADTAAVLLAAGLSPPVVFIDDSYILLVEI